MPNVYELQGSMRNIVAGDDLVFPNVQTCVAVVAVVAGGLLGAHCTLGDRGRLSEVAEQIKQRGAPLDVYVVGPIFGAYNVNSFANFGCPVHIHDCAGFIDVRASAIGGGVRFEKRPTGADSGWQEIPLGSFSG